MNSFIDAVLPLNGFLSVRRRETSRGPVSGSNLLAAALGGVVVLIGLGLTALAIEPIIEAAGFGFEYSELEAPFWIGLALLSSLAYAFLRLVERVSTPVSAHPVGNWLRRYVAFLAMLYGVLGVHVVQLVEATGSGKNFYPVVLFPVLQILLASSICALIWPLAFDIASWRRASKYLFGTSALVLLLSHVLDDPEIVTFALVTLELIEPPMDLVIGRSLSRKSILLIPILPVLWTLGVQWRARHGREDSASAAR